MIKKFNIISIHYHIGCGCSAACEKPIVGGQAWRSALRRPYEKRGTVPSSLNRISGFTTATLG